MQRLRRESMSWVSRCVYKQIVSYPTVHCKFYNLQSFPHMLQARDGNLAVEDMDGGTFTISNGGVFGSLYGTPIINPPQSAILGMHGVFDRPVAIDKKVWDLL